MSTTSKLCAVLSLCATAGVLAVTLLPGAQAQADNVLFEVTGTGKAYTVDTNPSTQRYYDVQLPWQDSTTIDSHVQMLQVVAVGKESPTPGCRITVNGSVVAEKAPGGDSHCIWTR